jgi:transposase
VAGIDVHKNTVVTCRRRINESGSVEKEVRTFSSMTGDLEHLCIWLQEWQVTHVALESTGVFWKPIWNILQDRFELLLVNAQHIKQVPGRKTDVKDCEWIAQLLQYGLLKGSFIPPPAIRDLRDLTRLRSRFTREQAAAINRVHKVLQSANIKLSSVATDIMGVSGKAIIRAIIAGETRPAILAANARGKLQSKIPQLHQALQGCLTEHHRFQLRLLMEHIDSLHARITEMDMHIQLHCEPFHAQIQLLKTHPAVKQRSAENLIAEIGVCMDHFPTSAHISSWAAVCPGNHQSAGKRTGGQTTKGNPWLGAVLTEISWPTVRTKTYLSARYRRIAKRRGKKRAIVAINHTNLIIFYHMLKHNVPYRELGPDYFDKIDPERTKRYHLKRLRDLGYHVELTNNAA